MNLVQISKEDFMANQNKLDKNTLYFVIDEDSEYGYLYLGNKNMLGVRAGDTELCRLADVNIKEPISNYSILVYNTKTEQWENKSRSDLVFVGTNGVANGIGGMVPGPKIEEKSYFLRGDGTWAPTANLTWKNF